jgi:hypothetical protein
MKVSRAPYIRVNEIKRSSGHILTSRIWELYLLAKLTTHTREGGTPSGVDVTSIPTSKSSSDTMLGENEPIAVF